MGLLLEADLIYHPIVEGSVITEFAGAEGVCDSLKCVLNGMRKVIHGVNAPLVALTVMMYMLDSVNNGVAEIRVIT